MSRDFFSPVNLLRPSLPSNAGNQVRFQHRKGHLREETQALQLEIDNLKQLRKKTEHHIPVNSLPEEDQFTRLCTERKHFIDTLKMIAYRAESSMASLLREHMARGGDAMLDSAR